MRSHSQSPDPNTPDYPPGSAPPKATDSPPKAVPVLERGSPPLRWLLLVAGILCTALALAGAVLPVLPTTPFLLVAAACFSRSSPAFHQRILANRLLGPSLAQWEKDHTVPRQAKRRAYVLILLTFTVSIYLADSMGVRLLHIGLASGVLLLIAHLPSTSQGTDRTVVPDEDPEVPGAC